MNGLKEALFLFLLFALSACQFDEGGPADVFSSGGYHYLKHKSGKGPVGKPGEVIYYHVQMRYGGAVRQDSRSGDNQPYYELPAEGTTSGQAPGTLVAVQDVLKELSVGDSVTIDIPVAEFPANIGGLSQNDTIYYDMVVTDIKTRAEFEQSRADAIKRKREKLEAMRDRAPQIEEDLRQMAQRYRNGELESELKNKESGLEYIITEEGEGLYAEAGNYATVFYCGALLKDGTIFQNVFKDGSSYTFPVGKARAIQGWDMGLPLFREGGKGYLFVPAELGYGAEGKGSIPPGADLVFYIEVAKVINLKQ